MCRLGNLRFCRLVKANKRGRQPIRQLLLIMTADGDQGTKKKESKLKLSHNFHIHKIGSSHLVARFFAFLFNCSTNFTSRFIENHFNSSSLVQTLAKKRNFPTCTSIFIFFEKLLPRKNTNNADMKLVTSYVSSREMYPMVEVNF